MMNHKKICTSVLIVFLLASSILLITNSLVNATTYAVTFRVGSGVGTISWVDNTSPYHDGSTTTTTTQYFPAGDSITITATVPFVNWYYSSAIYGSGYSTVNPISNLVISSSFSLTANFASSSPSGSPSLPYYRDVDFYDSGNGRTLAYISGVGYDFNDSSMRVPYPDSIQIDATPEINSYISQVVIVGGVSAGIYDETHIPAYISTNGLVSVSVAYEDYPGVTTSLVTFQDVGPGYSMFYWYGGSYLFSQYPTANLSAPGWISLDVVPNISCWLENVTIVGGTSEGVYVDELDLSPYISITDLVSITVYYGAPEGYGETPTPTPTSTPFIDLTQLTLDATSILEILIGAVLVFGGIAILLSGKAWFVGFILLIVGFAFNVIAETNIYGLCIFAIEVIISIVFTYKGMPQQEK